MSTNNGVFIIESLNLEDEEKGLFEGKILKEMLRMLGVDANYTYLRTKEELKVMIKKFEESNFKYLHLSCHGNSHGIGMTLCESSFPFSELSEMFEYLGSNKRLFLSSCSVMNGDRIAEEMCDTQFLSITGPLNDIGFTDSAIFWASFYHLIFSDNKESMNNDSMRRTIEKLSSTFNVEISTVIRRKSGTGYNRYDVREGKLEKIN